MKLWIALVSPTSSVARYSAACATVCSQIEMHLSTSARESAIGLPISSVIISAQASRSSRRASASSLMRLSRAVSFVARQSRNSLAAFCSFMSIAAGTSCSYSASVVPFAGFTDRKRWGAIELNAPLSGSCSGRAVLVPCAIATSCARHSVTRDAIARRAQRPLGFARIRGGDIPYGESAVWRMRGSWLSQHRDEFGGVAVFEGKQKRAPVGARSVCVR